MEVLKIIGVAVRHNGVTICLPKPNRHCDCIRYAVDILGLTPPISSLDQGFYLSNGKYLDRKRAAAYVRIIGQKLRSEKLKKKLYSEDLW